jgi:glycyl-tRNA synthetase
MYQSEDSPRIPFGVAQIDKVFRLEEFLGPFSLYETDAMTLVYFCPRELAGGILSQWERARLQWWKQYGHNKGLFSIVDTSCDEVRPMPVKQRAIMYSFPWGEDEIEQIIHLDHTSLEQLQSDIKVAIQSDNVPHCILVTSTIEKAFLTILFDGYQETQRFSKDGSLIQQKVCYFHPRLAPFKVAVLPAISDIAEFCKLADKLTDELRHAGVATLCDKEDDLEDRFIRQDEIGTPFCVIIDKQTIKKGLCQLRSRDTTLTVSN